MKEVYFRSITERGLYVPLRNQTRSFRIYFPFSMTLALISPLALLLSLSPALSRSISFFKWNNRRLKMLKTHNLCGTVQIIPICDKYKFNRLIPVSWTNIFNWFGLCAFFCSRVWVFFNFIWNIQNLAVFYFIRLIIMSVSRMATGYNIIIENQCDYPFFLPSWS